MNERGELAEADEQRDTVLAAEQLEHVVGGRARRLFAGTFVAPRGSRGMRFILLP